MKFFTLISAFATATLVSADQRAQLHSPGGSEHRLSARDSTCPRPMCKTPASEGPNDPPHCGDSYAACKYDQFPCGEHLSPKVTDTHDCFCIFANKKAMDAYCQERGFKSGTNPWKYHYAVECHGAVSDQVCNKDCRDQDRGHGRIDKAHPNGACACDKPHPPYDTCEWL